MIELVIVLAIIGTLAAIAMPRYTASLSNYRADATARRIVADLTFAQTRARAASSSQPVAFTVSQGRYQLVGVSDPDHPATPYTVNLSTSPYFATLVAVDLGGGSVVTFNGHGVPDRSGSITVRAGAAVRTIAFDAELGIPRIQ